MYQVRHLQHAVCRYAPVPISAAQNFDARIPLSFLGRGIGVKEAARKAGVTVNEIYWTLGRYDLVATTEGPDDLSATALGLALGAMGNVRTETMRAFGAEEMKQILAKIP